MARKRASFLGKTAIAGVGYTPFTANSGRTVLDIATQACRAAIDDAGLQLGDVDGVGSFSLLGDSAPTQALAATLGLPRVGYLLDLSMGGQAPCYLISQCAMAVEAGLADVVVAYRALNGRSGVRVGRGSFPGAAVQYRYPIGLTGYPQYFALWARRYLLESGGSEEDLASVPIAQSAYALLNDRAVKRRVQTLETYAASPMVSDPFRVADCTKEVDGACAVVITSLERARDLRWKPAVIEGAAYSAGPRPGLDIGDVLAWEDYSRNFTSVLAEDLWSSCGLRPSEVDVAEIYDCFSIAVLMALEGLGFCKYGEAADFIRSGATALGGSLPTNTHGGLLCEGYLHGMNTVSEAVLQLQGRSGPRQTEGAKVAAVTSGGLAEGSALVLRAE